MGVCQAKKPAVVIMTDGNNYTTKISETRFQVRARNNSECG